VIVWVDLGGPNFNKRVYGGMVARPSGSEYPSLGLGLGTAGLTRRTGASPAKAARSWRSPGARKRSGKTRCAGGQPLRPRAGRRHALLRDRITSGTAKREAATGSASSPCFPNWIGDGPWRLTMNDPEKTTIRSGWLEFGTGSAKNMDNEGGRPFLFPGKVPGYKTSSRCRPHQSSLFPLH
jgi:hypothetical protein